MNELIERLERAAQALTTLADTEEFGSTTRARLQGKASGIRLALSYLLEAGLV